MTFVEAIPSQGTYDEEIGIWAVGTIAEGETLTLQIVATVETPGEIVNVAQVSNALQPDVDSEPNNNVPTEDDQDEVTIGGIAADLELNKSVEPQVVDADGQVTFTLEVENNGSSPATGVQITDLLPEGLTFISSDASKGTYDVETGLWDIGGLIVGESETLNIIATVNGTGSVTNVAEITASDQPDPDSTPNNGEPGEDDQDEVTVVASQVDLTLEKLAESETALVGEQTSFFINLTNEGEYAATGVTVLDALPTGVAYSSFTSTKGTYNPEYRYLDSRYIAARRRSHVENLGGHFRAGTITNTAEVQTADQPDVDSTPANNDPEEDDQDSATISTVSDIDLHLEKTANVESIKVGEEFTYVLTLTNDGPSKATNIEVSDQLPTNVSYVGASANKGIYVSATGVWSIGELGIGESATLNIDVTASTEGEIVNIAQVSAADQPDVDSTPANNDPEEDDQDDVTVNVSGKVIDLELIKTASVEQTTIGSEVTYTITLTNKGPDPASGVQVFDQLPGGVQYQSNAANVGTYSPGRRYLECG